MMNRIHRSFAIRAALVSCIVAATFLGPAIPAHADLGGGVATCVSAATPHDPGEPDNGCPWIELDYFSNLAWVSGFGGHVTAVIDGRATIFTLSDLTLSWLAPAPCLGGIGLGTVELAERDQSPTGPIIARYVYDITYSVGYAQSGLVGKINGAANSVTSVMGHPVRGSTFFEWGGPLQTNIPRSEFLLACRDDVDGEDFEGTLRFEFTTLAGIHSSDRAPAPDELILDTAPSASVNLGYDLDEDRLFSCVFDVPQPVYYKTEGEMRFESTLSCMHLVQVAQVYADLYSYDSKIDTPTVDDKNVCMSAEYQSSERRYPECGAFSALRSQGRYKCKPNCGYREWNTHGYGSVQLREGTGVWLDVDDECEISETSSHILYCSTQTSGIRTVS